MSASAATIIGEAATNHGIDPKVLMGVYGTETNFGRDVRTSSAGAVGPFQFEPGTAKSLGINPYNFREAAEGAARYLAQYKSRGVAGMLSAYNAGPAGGLQPAYVKSVLEKGGYGAQATVPSSSGGPSLTGGVSQSSPSQVSERPSKAAMSTANTNALLNKLIGEEGLGHGLFKTSVPQSSPTEPVASTTTGGGGTTVPGEGSSTTGGAGGGSIGGSSSFNGKPAIAPSAIRLPANTTHGTKIPAILALDKTLAERGQHAPPAMIEGLLKGSITPEQVRLAATPRAVKRIKGGL